MAYVSSYKSQTWLIPRSICDMILEDRICFLVEDFVEELDFTASYTAICLRSGEDA